MPGRNSLGGSIEEYRAEIVRRANAGETCEQTADGLTANGFQVSKKTISRYRLQWGLRKRSARPVGKTYPDRKRKIPEQTMDVRKKSDAQAIRKQEITRRTLQGESVEQITAALEAQGFTFRDGVSTILRLQTHWKLIPYDHDRARGKGRYDKKKQAKLAERGEAPVGVTKPKPRPKKRQPPLAPSNPNETLHYPASCANGPQKGVDASYLDDHDPAPEMDVDELSNSGFGPEPMLPAAYTQPASPDLSINLAAELMSAEFLVDLATSTLSAAHRVKELYIARQANRPATGSVSGIPPTEDDIAAAKRKVREAASVMHDLALPNSNP